MEKVVTDISVLSANFNNGKFLKAFFDSIINSIVWPNEVVIVDDASSDNSVEIIETYSKFYDFIKLVKIEKNCGFANALNEGLKKCTSKYILRVDPDDYIHEDRIKHQFDFLENHPEYDIVGSNVVYVNSENNKEIILSNVPLEFDEISDSFVSGNCGLIHGSTLIRRTIFDKFNYNQSAVPAEDYQLFSLVIKNGSKVFNLSKPLTFVRIHQNSVSNNLPYSTIEKTFMFREKIWNKKASHLKVKTTHLYLLNYRKYLFTANPMKYAYLFLAAFFNPLKAIKRIIKNEN